MLCLQIKNTGKSLYDNFEGEEQGPILKIWKTIGPHSIVFYVGSNMGQDFNIG